MPEPPQLSPADFHGLDHDDHPTDETRPSAGKGIRDTEDLSGQQTHSYAFIKKLGSGGNCSVYEALCRERHHLVAIKVLHRNIASHDVTTQRFAQEIEAVKLIRHPNVITILDAGTLPDGRAFYVMERFDGASLSQLVRQRGRLPLPDALRILCDIAEGLDAAHRLGVIHRDIKPANILAGHDSRGPVVKIIDFGIAKIMRAENADIGLTADHIRVGSPVAMAPEQILGQTIDARTDIYALGVVAFYLLTGRYPFRSTDGVPIERYHLCTPPPHASSLAPVPMAIDEILFRALAKSPDARHQSVLDFVADLQSFLAQMSSPEEPGNSTTRPGIGVHVEVSARGTYDPDDDERDDEALFCDIDDILDAATLALSAARFTIQTTTGNSVLATQLVDGDGDRLSAAAATARELYDSLMRRPGAHPDVGLLVCVGHDRAVTERRDDAQIIIDGPLVRGSWLPIGQRAGFFVIDERDEIGPDEPTVAMQVTGASDRDRP